MEQSLYNDLIQSLNEAVAYANGDETQGRKTTIIIPDDEAEMDQMIFQQLVALSTENKEKVIRYANELAQASS